MLIIVSLFIINKFTVMHCARAIINFVIIARYISYNTKFLKYLNHALYCINKLKNVFKDSRSQISYKKTGNENDEVLKIDERHFNFFKFHVISYYKQLIKLYESVKNYDIDYFKATHKYLVKCFYDLINKRKDFQNQILKHNTRLMNMLAFEDTILH